MAVLSLFKKNGKKGIANTSLLKSELDAKNRLLSMSGEGAAGRPL